MVKKPLNFQLTICSFLLFSIISPAFSSQPLTEINIASFQSNNLTKETSILSTDQGFVSISGQSLFLNGSQVQFFGVNHADLIWSFIWPDEIDDNGLEVIETAGKHNLATIRFSAAGYYDWQTRDWLMDSNYYWTNYDVLILTAKENGVFLVPSLLWNPKQFSDVVGENPSNVFINGTKSNLLFRKYVEDIVSRYKDEQTILMWELGNEWNLFVEPRTNYYNITQLHSFINQTVQLIRSIDKNHIIGSGMAAPPQDINPTMEDALEHFAVVNDFVDIASIHTYPHDQNGHFYGITETKYIQMFLDKAKELNKPLMIGEFGSNKDDDPSSKFSLEVLNAAFNNNIAISLIWEWYVPRHNDYNRLKWNIDPISNPFLTRVLEQFSLTSFFKCDYITIENLSVSNEKTVVLYNLNESQNNYFLYTSSNSTSFILKQQHFSRNISLMIYGVEGWNGNKDGFIRITTPKNLLENNYSILLDNRCIQNYRDYSNDTYLDIEITYIFNFHKVEVINSSYCSINKTIFPFLTVLAIFFYVKIKKKREN